VRIGYLYPLIWVSRYATAEGSGEGNEISTLWIMVNAAEYPVKRRTFIYIFYDTKQLVGQDGESAYSICTRNKGNLNTNGLIRVNN
jgi:hypothetical protein